MKSKHPINSVKPQTAGTASINAEDGTGFHPDIPEGGICLKEVIKEYVRVALARTHGNQTKAAELLGISRCQLQRRVQIFGLNKEMFKKGRGRLP